MTRNLCGFLLALVFVLNAAALSSAPTKSTLKLPATPYRYANVDLPAYFTQSAANHDNTPPNNPLTDDGATLGRVLFYDTRLSANNTTSCGSCHVQAHAFADPNPSSKGFHGGLTDRRAMPLVNLRYYARARFFWDERAGNLEEMVLLPIQNRLEMGQDLAHVVDTFSRDETYLRLFGRAFGDRQVTEQRIGRALAQFVRSIVSYQSRYDHGRVRAVSVHDDFDNFTLQENRGKALFMRNCSSCHMKDGNEHFFVPTPANNGMRRSDPTADGGVGDQTLRFEDLGSFKSPSLRNVAVTAPYGHDGRLTTLDAVIDHYSDNAIFDPNIGYMIPVGPLKYTTSEKTALIAFLETLTDRTLLTDPKFSDPFVKHAAAQQADVVQRAARIEPPPAPALPALRPLAAPPPPPPSPMNTITERLMSFDSDGDLHVSRDELPERMRGLIARGDKNGDSALDVGEIRALIAAALSERTRVSFRPKQFDGLRGVISDMRLSPEKQERALAIVAAHKPLGSANEPIDRGIYRGMRSLLDDEEYDNFVAAATRLSKTTQGGGAGVIGGVPRGVVGGIVGGIVVR